MKHRMIRVLVAIISLVLILGIWHFTHQNPTAPAVNQAAVAATQSDQIWYIRSDSPVAMYDCPSIDCTVVGIVNGGSPVAVTGSAQGEAMIPIRYGSRTTYVIDSWLTRQPPVVQPAGIAPRGATATCKDGWTSYSANRRGTCSHHGGVRSWYR